MTQSEKALSHSILDDAQGLLSGTMLCALGVSMLTHLGLITGQTAGLAIVLSYATGLSFGLVFFCINIPFYWLAYTRIDARFTLKSFLAVSLVSGLTRLLENIFEIEKLNIGIGAALIGIVVGTGLVILFRHGSSLGGVGVLALYLQDKTGFRAGWTQLGFDILVFALALFYVPLTLVAYSLAGAVITNFLVGINHRRDRYVAT